MRTIGAKKVGRVSIDFEIANYEDMVLAHRGVMPHDQIRRQTISGIVDPRAAMLVLPPTVVKELGLPPGDKTIVRYADGHRAQRPQADGAYVEILGRHGTFTAVVEPKRTTALVGAIVLEALDLLVDNRRGRLIPRDPKGPVYEIE
jgi:predicted aspartyl protease